MSLVLPSIHAFGNSLANEGPMVQPLEYDRFSGSYTQGSTNICNGKDCNDGGSFCIGTNEISFNNLI